MLEPYGGSTLRYILQATNNIIDHFNLHIIVYDNNASFDMLCGVTVVMLHDLVLKKNQPGLGLDFHRVSECKRVITIRLLLGGLRTAMLRVLGVGLQGLKCWVGRCGRWG